MSAQLIMLIYFLKTGKSCFLTLSLTPLKALFNTLARPSALSFGPYPSLPSYSLLCPPLDFTCSHSELLVRSRTYLYTFSISCFLYHLLIYLVNSWPCFKISIRCYLIFRVFFNSYAYPTHLLLHLSHSFLLLV